MGFRGGLWGGSFAFACGLVRDGTMERISVKSRTRSHIIVMIPQVCRLRLLRASLCYAFEHV